MKLLFSLITVFIVLILIWHLLTKKYLNPYQLIIIFGKKGCGKSTLLQKLAVYYRKRGYHVYCNFGDSYIKECTQIPIQDIPYLAEAGHAIEHYKDYSVYQRYLEMYTERLNNERKKHSIDSVIKNTINPQSNNIPLPLKSPAVILCDEINLLWDNRNFKNFSPEIQRYFRLQRHYHHIFIGMSQTFDTDKKIRDLSDQLLICNRVGRVWIRTKSYVKKVVVVSPENENSRETATMTDDFVKLGFFNDLFSPYQAWLPKWVKYHDSYK